MLWVRGFEGQQQAGLGAGGRCLESGHGEAEPEPGLREKQVLETNT